MFNFTMHLDISNARAIESIKSYILYGCLETIHERFFAFGRLNFVVQKERYEKLKQYSQNDLVLGILSDRINNLSNKISNLDSIYNFLNFTLSGLNILQLYNLSCSILDLGDCLLSSNSIPLDKILLLTLNGACACEAVGKVRDLIIENMDDRDSLSEFLEILMLGEGLDM